MNDLENTEIQSKIGFKRSIGIGLVLIAILAIVAIIRSDLIFNQKLIYCVIIYFAVSITTGVLGVFNFNQSGISKKAKYILTLSSMLLFGLPVLGLLMHLSSHGNPGGWISEMASFLPIMIGMMASVIVEDSTKQKKWTLYILGLFIVVLLWWIAENSDLNKMIVFFTVGYWSGALHLGSAHKFFSGEKDKVNANANVNSDK